VYRTDDFGATWRAIAATLPPAAPANVLVEDHANPSLLFLGTDRGLFASIDAGARWVPFQSNMPVVPVRDLVIHPRENDLVAGTYGRGVWVADITPLQQISGEVLASDVHLFAPEPKGLRIETAWGNYRLFGDDVLATQNEPNGMPIVYWQRDAASGPVTIRVSDAGGRVVFTAGQTAGTGLQRALWNLRVQAERSAGRGAGRGGRGGGGAPAPPGNYTITLEAAGRTLTQTATVKPSVMLPRISGPGHSGR
jgi:hypothetical protein